MDFNTAARLENRKNEFMKMPEFRNVGENHFAISLRKENRNKLVKQRRKHQEDEKVLETPVSVGENLIFLSFSDQINRLLAFSNVDIEGNIRNLKTIRRLCSKENNFQLLRYPAYVSALIPLLDLSIPDEISYLVLSIITKLLSGNSKTTRIAINLISLSEIRNAIHLTKPKTTEQAIWAFGNIAGDSAELRNLLLSTETHTFLIKLCVSGKNLPISKALSFFFMNLSRCQSSLPYQDFENILYILKIFLQSSDEDVLCNTLSALEVSSKENLKKIQMLLNANILSTILDLSLNPSLMISEFALRVVGNLSYGDNAQVQQLIDGKILDFLHCALNHGQAIVRKEALYSIGNIIANSAYFLQFIIEHPVCEAVIEKLKDTDYSVRKENSFVFYNISMLGIANQVKELVKKDVFVGLKHALRTSDPELLKNFLNFVVFALKSDKITCDSLCVDALESSGCIEIIETLQKHMNPVVYSQVAEVLKYFALEDPTEICEDTPMIFIF